MNLFSRRSAVVLLLLCLLSLAGNAPAAVRLSGVFGDHMVLQRDLPITIWGWADPAESVTISFAGQTVSTTADASGCWSVQLAALSACAVPRELLVSGLHSSLKVSDVLVGEVWLCSGQSNMEWALARSDGGSNAIASSAHPLLRMGRVPHNVQLTPQRDVPVKWEVSAPVAAQNFSAIPYWFGLHLQAELGVPVGILNSAFGGTPIQSWMSAETLQSGPWPQDAWNNLKLARAAYNQKVQAALALKKKYDAEKAAALAQKLPAPPAPAGLPSEFKGATTLWNGEVVPLLPFRLRGVAWYQGENNAYVQVAHSYGDLLSAMIRDWRQGFSDPNLPFLIFQIARNRKPQTHPNEPSGIAELQAAQARVALATPHAGLIVTTDQGGPDVHYHGKEPVARRAVNAALALVYGRSLPWASPTVSALSFTNGQACVTFTNTAGGLVAHDGPLSGFVLAGADRKFVFAQAKIAGDTVLVSSPQVPNPVAVRYGWADLPNVNLFNQVDLPASTFRSDDWPLPGTSTN